MKNVLKSLTAAASVIDATIHKKMFGSGRPRMLALLTSDLASSMTTLIISNEEINYIMKIVTSLEDLLY